MTGEYSLEKSENYFNFYYDLQNRLIQVDNGEGFLVSYVYDSNNLRVLRTDSTGIETRYVFDINGNVIEKHNNKGDSDYYIWRTGRHLARRDESGNTYYYGTDHSRLHGRAENLFSTRLGTTVFLTDERGREVWSGETTLFGDTVVEDGSLVDEEELMYTGKELEELTGLYYFNARWYDPTLGKFITEDPIKDGMNWIVLV